LKWAYAELGRILAARAKDVAALSQSPARMAWVPSLNDFSKLVPCANRETDPVRTISAPKATKTPALLGAT
jgi:hypothetical protein